MKACGKTTIRRANIYMQICYMLFLYFLTTLIRRVLPVTSAVKVSIAIFFAHAISVVLHVLCIPARPRRLFGPWLRSFRCFGTLANFRARGCASEWYACRAGWYKRACWGVAGCYSLHDSRVGTMFQLKVS